MSRTISILEITYPTTRASTSSRSRFPAIHNQIIFVYKEKIVVETYIVSKYLAQVVSLRLTCSYELLLRRGAGDKSVSFFAFYPAD